MSTIPVNFLKNIPSNENISSKGSNLRQVITLDTLCNCFPNLPCFRIINTSNASTLNRSYTVSRNTPTTTKDAAGGARTNKARTKDSVRNQLSIRAPGTRHRRRPSAENSQFGPHRKCTPEALTGFCTWSVCVCRREKRNLAFNSLITFRRHQLVPIRNSLLH